jgi:hypothetical protein
VKFKSEWATAENRRIEGQNEKIREKNRRIETKDSGSYNKRKKQPLKRVNESNYKKDNKKNQKDSLEALQSAKFSGRNTNSAPSKTLYQLSLEPEATRYVQGTWDGFYGRQVRL